jgi:hypothetical protein
MIQNIGFTNIDGDGEENFAADSMKQNKLKRCLE